MVNLRNTMISHFENRRFGEALPLALEMIRMDSDDYYPWYVAGQCYRFQNDFVPAVSHLIEAATRKPEEPAVFLALGIAHQLNDDLENSLDALKHAIEIDADYAGAYNSLGLTLKQLQRFELANETYDAGANALARSIVKAMVNSQYSQIVNYRESRGQLWAERAMYAALYIAAQDDSVENVAWPTGAEAEEEERTRRHEGLYWLDTKNSMQKSVRLFLPNYFNTFNRVLRNDSLYFNLVGNRGTVLELLGRTKDATLHFEEAAEFSPAAS